MLLLLVLLNHSLLISGQCTIDQDCHPPIVSLYNSIDTPPGSPIPRSVTATQTCGVSGASPYRQHSGSNDPTEYQCTAGDTNAVFFLTDRTMVTVGDYTYNQLLLNTHWQSINTVTETTTGVFSDPTEVTIDVELTNPLLIRKIQLIFVNPQFDPDNTQLIIDMRPKAMAIERRVGELESFQLWRIFAEDCSTITAYGGMSIPVVTYTDENIVNVVGGTYEPTVPFCEQRYFSGDSATYTGWDLSSQQMQFNPSSDFQAAFSSSMEVQAYYMASAIRIRFFQPSERIPLSSYYAIGDMEIEGQCSCFGHADTCLETNQNVCHCQHNTMGTNCEQCMPLFNDRPWMVGAEGVANECVDCGCGGHADECIYSDVKAYGVCQSCRDNTIGDKCEYCGEFYNVNPGNVTELTAEPCTGFGQGDTAIEYPCNSRCIPCDCNRDGTVETVTDTYSCDNVTGQCQCKMFVQGLKCDECMDEYWQLQLDLGVGCLACSCHLSGTLNNTNLCNKTTGECLCKSNVTGQTCNQCVEGSFSLTSAGPDSSNEDGCSLCDCDPGGSMSLQCNPVGGACSCRSNIGGRRCDQPTPANFGALLSQMTYEAELADNNQMYIDAGQIIERPGHGELSSTFTGIGFVQLNLESNSLVFTIDIPNTWVYEVHIRYEGSASSVVSATDSFVRLSRVNPVADNVYTCGADASSRDDTDIVLIGQSNTPAGDGMAMGILDLHVQGTTTAYPCLGTGEYILTIEQIARTPPDAVVYVDAIVLLPRRTDFDVYTSTDAEMQGQIDNCYTAIVNVNRYDEAEYNCDQIGYSIMAELYGGATGCMCNDVGSVPGEACDPIGGQCPCRPGVMLQDCSRCMVNYYGFASGNGCTACDCDIGGSVLQSCGDDGICSCHPNVTGTQCNACEPEHYGLATNSGCTLCTCNLLYSYNNSCMDNGQCHCKPGVGGLNCDVCLDMYYNMTITGCSECNCDPSGSIALTCAADTGVCTCRDQVTGDKCDQCAANHFALGEWTTEGCLPCFCWDHLALEGGTCTSAAGFFLAAEEDEWSLLDGTGAIQEPWLAMDNTGNAITVEVVSVFPGEERAQFVMEITNIDEAAAAADFYYLAPQRYLGDKRSSYGLNLTFTIGVHDPNLPPDQTWVPWDGAAAGDIILEGTYSDNTFVRSIDPAPNENMTTYVYPITESEWRYGSTGLTPDYRDFIQVLADLSAIKFRGKFTNNAGAVTRLYNAKIEYSSRGSLSGIPVNNVEECGCAIGYQGLSCESCAPSYTRAVSDGGADINCGPCVCNGHESNTIDYPCDPTSGVCVCLHNTEGDHCEVCSPGYYGNTTFGQTDDCLPCMCPGNVIAGDLNVFSTHCILDRSGGGAGVSVCQECAEGHTGNQCEQCMDGYWGTPEDPTHMSGRCVLCDCNDRAATCNRTTGECIACEHPTGGHFCTECAAGYHGTAGVEINCEPCACTDQLGYTGDCDHVTGRCVCEVGVAESETCDQCMTNYYNYQDTGCEPCDCDTLGSTSSQCDVVSGECPCLELVTGRQCNQCEAMYTNVNAVTGCDPCLCDPTGIYQPPSEEDGVAGTCDVLTRQCICIPGTAITGLTCNTCSPGTLESYVYVQGISIGEHPNCELCGECFDNWARKIDEVGLEIKAAYDEAMAIWDHYDTMTDEDVAPFLTFISSNLTSVESSITEAQTLQSDLVVLQSDFTQMMNDVDSYNLEMDSLQEYHASVNSDLTTLQTFTGRVIVDQAGTVAVTTQQLQADYIELQVHVTDQQAAALASNTDILSMTEAITVYNGNVDGFTIRVTAGIVSIDTSRDRRLAIDGMWTSIHEEELTNNSISIVVLREALLLMPTTHSSITGVLQQAIALTGGADTTATQAEEIVLLKSEEMLIERDNSEMVAYNSSLAYNASLVTQIEANMYKDLVDGLLEQVTEIILEVVGALDQLAGINIRRAALHNIAFEIETVILPTMGSLQTLTNEIAATTIDQAMVDQTYADATAALNTAADALAITTAAATQSSLAVTQVSTIQSNIADVDSINTQTQTDMDRHNVISTDVRTNAAQATHDSNTALAMGQQTNQTINIIQVLVEGTSQCFENVMATAEATRVTAETSYADMDEVTTRHAQNERLVMSVTREAAVESEIAITRSAQLDSVNEEMNELRADIDTITSVINVGALLTEFSQQKIEMETLESELLDLQSEMDHLLLGLEPMEADNTVCTLE